MKLKHLPHCLALSAGLFSGQQALAGDLLHWQDNSLSYLYGENFQRMNFNGWAENRAAPQQHWGNGDPCHETAGLWESHGCTSLTGMPGMLCRIDIEKSSPDASEARACSLMYPSACNSP